MKTKNVYEGILSFQGTWRNYQERILHEADAYMADKRIHIVAAPGAGKTTLGIELIRRTGAPCLVLSPRIIIRQQWLERIRESFLPREKRENADKFFSDNIKDPRLITSVTYQTLFCGMTGKKAEEEECEVRGEREETDYTGFDLVNTVKEAGVRTICLDECHHLKNEWWKALETFMEEMGDVTVIALTATPPYDSAPGQWEKYIQMCGPIDAEITVPELVKEGSLCPHQDYVWFNYPSAEEDEQVYQFRKGADEMFRLLMEDRQLREAAASHKALFRYDEYCDPMLENPCLLSSLLIYCQACGIPFSGRWLQALDVKSLPDMDERWMGYFIQGILFDDRDNYELTDEFRAILTKELKIRGLIRQKKVNFLTNEKVEKMLAGSRGKMNSILQIAACEHAALGNELRMLILTDYIRQEYRAALGNPDRELYSMGVFPIFELLRRKGAGWRLGVLCGSVILLPDRAVDAFRDEAREADPQSDPVFTRLTGTDGKALGYSQFSFSGKKEPYIRAVTRLFERGYIQILTGTRSLLGEGWDSPCINSLIMASFVGSYVTGGQMRGRAIRTCKWDPGKVSNIWHLVCICDVKETQEKRRMGIKNPELSEDYYTLERRMQSVVGVNYDGTLIENGIERLSVISAPYTRAHTAEMNEEMAARSRDRMRVARQWENGVSFPGGREAADACTAKRRAFRPGARFRHALAAQAVCTAVQICNMIFRMLLRTGQGWENPVFFLITGAFLICTILFCRRLPRLLFPVKRFQAIGNAVLSALKEGGYIVSQCQVITEERDKFLFCSWLQGGTDREKNVYADTLQQTLSPVENQRYLLIGGRVGKRRREYYCVPALFAGTRKKAELFQKCMNMVTGRSSLVYTRNPEGRKMLIKARACSFFNQNERYAVRKKYIRGKLE